MFTAHLKESNIFKRIIESIKDLVTVVNFDIKQDGISFQAMDQSHVALVALFLSSEMFQSYRLDKNFTLGIKLQNLNKILKCGESTDSLTLECDQEDPQVLTLSFSSERHEKKSKFALNLVNQDEEALQLPETVYSSKVCMPSAEFSRIIRELTQLSETISIKVTQKSITFEVKGDITTGEIELHRNNVDKLQEQVLIECDEVVKNNFALNFLNMFCKAATLSDQVVLNMSVETPVIVEYKLGTNGSLKFYLAPKVND